MGTALLGAALASFPGVAWADDDCRRLGRECRRDSQCCSRNCIRRGDDKVCACPTGQSRCGDRCVNLKTNERHCGSCSNACGSNQTCCNGNCVNLQRNERHCGRCFNRCDEGEECVGGVCQPSCIPFGVECTDNDQCCSGRCASFEPELPRVCNDPCPVGRVPLSNGTCAVPCTTISMPPSGADCVPPGAPTGTISNCDACSAEADTGDGFCAGAPQGPCEGTLDCPEGQFCVAGTCVSRCNPEI
jgi:Stigma-specific protein, Stig1